MHNTRAKPRTGGDDLKQAILAHGSIAEACTWLSSHTSSCVTPAQLYHWINRGVPAKYAVPLEHWTRGSVTRYALRPDVFGTL